MDCAAEWIVLAQVLRPQGRRGEVLADLFTDFPERFAQHPRVWLAPAGFAEGAGEAQGKASGETQGEAENRAPSRGAGAERVEQAEVTAHWLPVGRNAGRIVLHFAGVDSIEKAERLTDKEVIVPRSERLPLEDGAAYISDLVGATVYDGEVAVGVVESVQFPTAPDGLRRLEEAAPLLAVASPEGEEVLVPFASAFLVRMDTEAKTIHMVLPEGLVQVNARGHGAVDAKGHGSIHATDETKKDMGKKGTGKKHWPDLA